MKKIDWANIINNLDVEFPTEGLDMPEEEEMGKSNLENTVGNLTRLTLDIFIFDNDELEQAYMMQNDKIRIYQNISLKDAVALANKNNKKKS